MKKFTLCLKITSYLVACFICISFLPKSVPNEEAEHVQQKLILHYNSLPESQKINKYELKITNNGFCRYKRFFSTGKVEYFSFNLVKFKDIDYFGTSQTGMLYLRTKGEDVIVQTYNDKKAGDIDSMATFMTIPLKNIEAEDLNEFLVKFQKMSLSLRR